MKNEQTLWQQTVNFVRDPIDALVVLMGASAVVFCGWAVVFAFCVFGDAPKGVHP
jgi:hypothetical protein